MKKKIFVYMLPVLLFMAFLVSSASGDNGPAAPAINTLSRYNVTHDLGKDSLTLKITGRDLDNLAVKVEESILTISEKVKNAAPVSQSFTLPAAVDDEKMSIDRKNDVIVIKLPLLNDGALKKNNAARVPGGRKWYFNDRDMRDLFDFKVPAFQDESDVYMRKFFEDDDFGKFDKYFNEMMRFRKELNKKMNIEKNPFAGNNSFSEYNVTHRIDGNNLIVDIAGNNLNDVQVSVENGVMKIQNKVSNKNTYNSENQTGEVDFYSSFMQSFTLPVNVEATAMKVEKLDKSVKVTLPIVKEKNAMERLKKQEEPKKDEKPKDGSF
ncbi:MAG TPA: Hsp20/alpha crystallin family protein [Candidatus Wallbacteria bacterium]|nr:Hsp20/alpha crystallin family protein [Candidatus Wallbacteria bacterium]